MNGFRTVRVVDAQQLGYEHRVGAFSTSRIPRRGPGPPPWTHCRRLAIAMVAAEVRNPAVKAASGSMTDQSSFGPSSSDSALRPERYGRVERTELHDCASLCEDPVPQRPPPHLGEQVVGDESFDDFQSDTNSGTPTISAISRRSFVPSQYAENMHHVLDGVRAAAQTDHGRIEAALPELRLPPAPSSDRCDFPPGIRCSACRPEARLVGRPGVTSVKSSNDV